MLDLLALISDPYDRQARLKPALLTMFPILVLIVLLIPEFDLIWASVGGFILYCGVTMFLKQVGRDRGKRLEPALFEAWGGKPSVIMLRHSDTQLDVITKERYRSFLMSAVPELKLPSEEDERKCPQKSDVGYESATAWLLTQTRDRERFDLLFRENINYGFRRNIWAFKLWAFIVDGIVMTIAMITILISDLWTTEIINFIQSIDMRIWASIALTFIHMLSFMFIVRKKWVQRAAETYARQLLAACDTLEGERKV